MVRLRDLYDMGCQNGLDKKPIAIVQERDVEFTGCARKWITP